jgi:hypothetical protein
MRKKEVRDLETKEMLIEEKYDKLYDQYVLTDVIAMAFVMEMGLSEKYMDYSFKIMKKMMPSLMGSAFKFMKMLSPGRAFKMFVEGIFKDSQVTEPLANVEIVSLSDREAVIKTKNSVMLKKYKDILKKSGLKLDLKEYYELMNEAGKGMAKEFGFDMTIDTSQIDEDITTVILKLAT